MGLDEYGFDVQISGYEAVEEIPSVRVRDMRRPTPVAELPEAAMRLGVGYMSGPLLDRDGREKFTVSGTEEEVALWMEAASEVPLWKSHRGLGLVDIYGDPKRGFAGAYLPAQ